MTYLRLSTFAAVVAVLATLLLSGHAIGARDSPQPSAATATTETLSALATTDGYCVPTNGTTSLDLSSITPTGSRPARITAAMANKVRFVSLTFIGGTTSTRICHRLGGSLQAAACNALDADAVGVLLDGGSVTYAVARDLTAGALIQIEAQANAGTDGAVCVTLGW